MKSDNWRSVKSEPPKPHKDYLFYRGDAGVFVGKLTSMDAVLTSDD